MRVLMFLLFYAILFFGDTLMAGDTSRQGRLAGIGADDPRITQTKDEAERHLDMLFEKFIAGEISMGDAMKLHRDKFYGGQMPDYNALPKAQPPGMMRRPNAQPAR